MAGQCQGRITKPMKIIFNNLIRRLIPWIAMILTRFRYTDSRSRFLDRLQVLAD